MTHPEYPLIVVTGPESSGKTTLAEALSAHTGWPLVAEWARQRLAEYPVYGETDVCRMALGQFRTQETRRRSFSGPVLADTDLLTYRIWLEDRFGGCPSWLTMMHRRHGGSLYLLCRPDMPWEPDPLRENPRDRDRLWEAHLRILEGEGWPYRILSGGPAHRMSEALGVLQEAGWLQAHPVGRAGQ
ncbi:MAG: ATP-binding protein [Saprospiraceae bacterium]|nr:ATP-binding protein [Saprospiraceae bacterium]